MKKTYINPQVIIVSVKPQLMTGASETIETKGNYGDGSGITLGSRRGGSSWEDDEE